ncbi:AAA-like domain protein [Ceratobasidium sp. AG-Ba]|nr:AAA-like domain protein [Ceratobasidium sp. AG-Ba]
MSLAEDFIRSQTSMDGIPIPRATSPIAINGTPRPLASLHLHPLTGSPAFYPKTIPLPVGNRVVIGRAQAGDSEDGTNGLFACQWMSRNHALVWAGQDGKILIRDTRSSNGTWINGNRLSGKGEKSERFNLQSHDILEFGEGQDGVPTIKAEVFDDPTLCAACKSLPVAINSPLVSSLKRQRTLSNGGRNSPKPPLRHRLRNDSDETLMGSSRPRSVLRDSVVVDEKALPKTPKLERSSSLTSFTTAAKNPTDNFEAEFSLLDIAGPSQPSGSDDHELKTAPLVTREALDMGVNEHIKQYGLLGQVAAVYSKSRAERFRDPRIYVNTNAPMSTVVCGVQGSGKSHTVGVLLENMLLSPDSRLGQLKKPLSGLVLHYGEGSATTRTPCEAAHIALATDPSITPPPVHVYVSPASLNTMKTVYAPLGAGVVVEPLYFAEEELDAQAFLSIMAVSGGSDSAPLYMQIVLSILRELGENYSYSEFTRRLNESRKNFNPAQSAGLEQRMALLNSFLEPSSRNGSTSTSVRRASMMSTASASVTSRRAPRFAGGQLTIIDLSDPFIDPASAASLFDILLRLFVRADVGTGKVCVVDEAHKYLSTETGKGATSELTQSLLSLIRQQRHLAMRVIISTQEPTVLPPVLIDLCSCLIMHRFSSKRWYDHLMSHIAADMPDDTFAQLVSLKTGQAIVISPACIAAFTPSSPPTAGSSANKKSVAQLSRRYLVIKTRKRLTNDGGASIMVV